MTVQLVINLVLLAVAIAVLVIYPDRATVIPFFLSKFNATDAQPAPAVVPVTPISTARAELRIRKRKPVKKRAKRVRRRKA